MLFLLTISDWLDIIEFDLQSVLHVDSQVNGFNDKNKKKKKYIYKVDHQYIL